MSQSRKFAAHGAAVHPVRKELLDKIADVVATGCAQQALAFFSEFGELADVSCVSGNRQARQSLLDSQVVEEPGYDTRIGRRRHIFEYEGYRTLGKVTRGVRTFRVCTFVRGSALLFPL